MPRRRTSTDEDERRSGTPEVLRFFSPGVLPYALRWKRFRNYKNALRSAQTSEEGSEHSDDSETSQRARDARHRDPRPGPVRRNDGPRTPQAKEAPAKAPKRNDDEEDEDERKRSGTVADATVVEVEPGLMEHIQVRLSGERRELQIWSFAPPAPRPNSPTATAPALTGMNWIELCVLLSPLLPPSQSLCRGDDALPIVRHAFEQIKVKVRTAPSSLMVRGYERVICGGTRRLGETDRVLSHVSGSPELFERHWNSLGAFRRRWQRSA